MAGIEKQVEKEKKIAENPNVEHKSKGIRADIDDEDDEESYYRSVLSLVVSISHLFRYF